MIDVVVNLWHRLDFQQQMLAAVVLALLGGLVVSAFFALFLSGTISQDEERAERRAEWERRELERMDDEEAGT